MVKKTRKIFQDKYEDNDSHNLDEEELAVKQGETDWRQTARAHAGDIFDTTSYAAPGCIQIAPKTDNAFLALRESSVLIKPSNSPLFNSITISDDQSAGSKIAERNLLALRGRKTSPEPGNRIHDWIKTINAYHHQEILLSQPAGEPLGIKALPRQWENSWSSVLKLVEPTIGNIGVVSSSSSADQVTSATSLQSNETTPDAADMQHLLSAHDHSQLDLKKLQDYIELLQSQVKNLESSHKELLPSRIQVLHRIMQKHKDEHKGRTEFEWRLSSPYFDEPEWIQGQHDQRQLRCSLPVTNFELYLERNKDIAFIVYRDFHPAPPDIAGSSSIDRPVKNAGSVRPLPISETIQPIAQELIEAIETLLSSRDEYSSLLQEYKVSPELQAPYLTVYHSRKDLHTIREGLSPEPQKQFDLLLQYVTDQYGENYAAADSLFSESKISSENVPYLFKPGDVLVRRSQGQYAAFVASSWPIKGSTKDESSLKSEVRSGDHLPLYGSHEAFKRVANEKIKVQSWSVTGWSWAFDGSFQRQNCTRYFEIEVGEANKHDAVTHDNTLAEQKQRTDANQVKILNIGDLSIFPLAYAEPALVDKLQRRGGTFWKCRHRRLVSYMEKGMDNTPSMVEERYMIDLKTYCSLHSNNIFAKPLLDELGADAMAKNEPPDEKFSYVLPPNIKGYNLRLKKWFDLEVDRISEVNWNVEAFETLVVERKARNLILALVSNQIATERSTDLIAGKGNGLILLLHGGPGTGKTLTAESVAEIAQKPLYRVTCGDVGTKAEDVEKYLESVLHLGKIWGCVVLLDEADVFLEQRSLEDLQRNALVSVFLRVMEYYEGILVLTSNRVGTFDEAFKSRIQLALHYPSLGQYQRLRVWENFINRLESFGDDKVETQDLRDHLEDLSKEKMNGREIRNAITTARQYAEWQSAQSKDGGTKRMGYEHLKDVIEVAGRFDKYLDKIHGGFSADELAEEDGLRLS
ncbi:hypothetical protein LTR96_003536 [Exophiala xenobiotica]|nr:hypothetical protein LTR96_003536 [Exophiala xenobiotica]KAK5342944.1 hypothetical protein LTR98_000572 [Exophiala xenobiotica]